MKYQGQNGKIYEANSVNQLPPGSYTVVAESNQTSPGCSCTTCASDSGIKPAGDVTGGQMRVDSQAICDLPANEPIDCGFTPCLPGVFADCMFALWSYDPYSGMVFCKPGDVWTAAKLDRCPTVKSKLYVDDSGDTPAFYLLIDGAYYQFQQTEWVQWNYPIPSCLSFVHRNPATGEYVYYAAVSESSQRVILTDVLFCSGTV